MFKIGEFSRLVRVSPRMLRHYEKCGLLYPAQIDAYTGYRQYSAGQIPLVSGIVTLRDMGFAIDEIGEILPHREDFAYMHKVLRAKAETVQAAIETEQAKLSRLMHMSDTMRREQNIMILDVELKRIPVVNVISLRGVIPHYNQEGLLWEKLSRFVGEQGIDCKADGYSTFFDEEYMDENPEVEIAIPVDALGESQNEFVYQQYEEIPLAATIRFTGQFDGGYDAASEKLAMWMENNGYAFAGRLRGHMITGPDTQADPAKWETELQVPVVKK